MLAEWIRVKHPGERFELVVVGGAAMALEGFKDQTKDVDVIRPRPLPKPILEGAARITKIRRLSPGWLNADVGNMLSSAKGAKKLPDYFNEISRGFQLGENLKISVIGRQALVSLKLYAASPSYTKHTVDLARLDPSAAEITEATRFVLSLDSSQVRRDDLRIVMNELGFDFDAIHRNLGKRSKQSR